MYSTWHSTIKIFHNSYNREDNGLALGKQGIQNNTGKHIRRKLKGNGPPGNRKRGTDGKKLKRRDCVYTVQISVH